MNNKDRYAVFGNPISHSKSPLLQMSFAQQTQQNIIYTAEHIELDQFSSTADTFFSNGGKGLNITVPFKIEAFNYATQLTERAKKAGAVNTLIKQGVEIIGDNTDGIGFVNDVLDNLHWTLQNKNILILGAGGAVRGILEPLLNALPNAVVIANRSIEKAEQLADDFSAYGNINACQYSDLDRPFDIIINASSASLNGKLPDINAEVLHESSYCYDMMYAKNDTVFMQWAKTEGAAAVADGLGMLVCQGAESFYQWRNKRPKTQSVITMLRDAL
ncbi:MAG: shikimate dehydrogenase [Candidatus Endobugula sp.]|jgi:shikimate dehydrogenase